MCLFCSFLQYANSITELPICFYATKLYYEEKNQNLNHLKEFYKPPDSHKETIIERLLEISEEFYEALKEMDLGD